MESSRLDYDLVASSYDRRFEDQRSSGIAEALLELCRGFQPGRVLEAGCGTARWLSGIRACLAEIGLHPQCYGLDLSAGMLVQARRKDPELYLTCGRAARLAYQAGTFDLVCCVNALHHFERPSEFILASQRVLRPAGRIALIGMDLHQQPCTWYIYDYFAGTLETDLARYPRWDQVHAWLLGAGFESLETRIVEHYRQVFTGEQVFEDPFLRKGSTSQLALLSDEKYQAGLNKMRRAIRSAAERGERVEFQVDISMGMLTGQLPEK
jgi:ubiquinone/menaquinone biosynthesis C-methylase UbiE